jgi:hypothetical protein
VVRVTGDRCRGSFHPSTALRADGGSDEEAVPESVDETTASTGAETQHARTDTEITRRPTRSGSAIAVAAAGVATVTALFGNLGAGGIAAMGFAIVGFALLGGRRGLLDLGALVLFGGVAFGAVRGAAILWVLFGTVATILAWDAGGTAMSMGRQLGREASTTRAEVMHAVVGGGVGLVAIGTGYSMYLLASGGQPVSALVVMLLAIALLITGLRL